MSPETGFRYGQAVELHFAEYTYPDGTWKGNKTSGGVVRSDEETITIRRHDKVEWRYHWADLRYVIRADNCWEWAEEAQGG